MTFGLDTSVVLRLLTGQPQELAARALERYQKGIDQLDKMQMDIDVIKLTITGHSEQLQNYSGPYLIK